MSQRCRGQGEGEAERACENREGKGIEQTGRNRMTGSDWDRRGRERIKERGRGMQYMGWNGIGKGGKEGKGN